MENLSKIVVSKSEGRRVGFILDIAISDAMQKLGYYVVDEESEGEFLLPYESILSTSGSVVLIEDVSVLQFSSERSFSVLGKEILDEQGYNLGKVIDMAFNNKKCEKFITSSCEIGAKFVRKIGKDYIFVSFKKRKPQKVNQGFPRADEAIVVQIQNFQNNVEPERVRLSSSFYIGKVCTQDIFGYNNEKIVLSGDIITRAIVEKAKRHNKLNQLFFAIKR